MFVSIALATRSQEKRSVTLRPAMPLLNVSMGLASTIASATRSTRPNCDDAQPVTSVLFYLHWQMPLRAAFRTSRITVRVLLLLPATAARTVVFEKDLEADHVL